MKRNVSVVCVCSPLKFRCNTLISGKIIKEMPGSVASGTPFTKHSPRLEFLTSTTVEFTFRDVTPCSGKKITDPSVKRQ